MCLSFQSMGSWRPLAGVSFSLLLLALLGLPLCSEGLRCYSCTESVGCYRNLPNKIEECGGETGKWVCLSATTIYYIPLVRKGCATLDELNCYISKNVDHPIESLDPTAKVTIGKEDYYKCYKEAHQEITIPNKIAVPSCPSQGRQDEAKTTTQVTPSEGPQNKTRGEDEWRYTIHVCETDFCNAKPGRSQAAISTMGNWKLTWGSVVLLFLVTIFSV